MSNLIYLTLFILSLVALVAIIGAFGMKFFLHKENKKIEVIINSNDNLKKQ